MMCAKVNLKTRSKDIYVEHVAILGSFYCANMCMHVTDLPLWCKVKHMEVCVCVYVAVLYRLVPPVIVYNEKVGPPLARGW